MFSYILPPTTPSRTTTHTSSRTLHPFIPPSSRTYSPTHTKLHPSTPPSHPFPPSLTYPHTPSHPFPPLLTPLTVSGPIICLRIHRWPPHQAWFPFHFCPCFSNRNNEGVDTIPPTDGEIDGGTPLTNITKLRTARMKEGCLVTSMSALRLAYLVCTRSLFMIHHLLSSCQLSLSFKNNHKTHSPCTYTYIPHPHSYCTLPRGFSPTPTHNLTHTHPHTPTVLSIIPSGRPPTYTQLIRILIYPNSQSY